MKPSPARVRWLPCLFLLTLPAHAFKIDPWSYAAAPLSTQGVEQQMDAFVNNPRQILLGPVSWVSQVPAAMGQLKEPVHENLSDLSIRCARAPARVENGVIVACAGRAQLARRADDLAPADQALIRASRWSDAPPMRPGSFVNPSRLLCGEVRVPENAACWALLMAANGAAASADAHVTPVVVNASDGAPGGDSQSSHSNISETGDSAPANLLRRSHYGDMQFLHAMAAPGESPARTRERILAWARFTYQVATGAISTDALISSLDLPLRGDILRGFEACTVHQFFETRAGATPEAIRSLALGALLHMVQDSFSAAHSARQMTQGDTPAPFGAITTFHDYACQSPAAHAEADRASSSPWLSASTRPAGDPVTLGAQLIVWARAGASWDSLVRNYAERSIFPLADAVQLQTRVANGRCAASAR